MSRRSPYFFLLFAVVTLTCAPSARPEDKTATNSYAPVDAIFTEHCLDCHAASDPEAKLVLEDYESLVKGGENGPAIKPGHSAESLLIQMVEGNLEREGKKKIMPPGKRAKLTAQEIATLKSWIDAGASAPPAGSMSTRILNFPKIAPKADPRKPINALAYTANGKLLAAARYGQIELIAAEDQDVVRTIEGLDGNVNAVAFSSSGGQVFAAAGENSVYGEVKEFNVADGKLIKTFRGHHDAIFAVALSPDGRFLATGSYDQKIKIWDIETGKELRTLNGHNGAVFGLAFRPDGKVLASASSNRTVKLWDPATGDRLDTLSQSLKELYSVAFTPDGARVAAAGADNRIRVWEVSAQAKDTPPPLISRFAHEGAILRLAFSSDGKWILSSAQDLSLKLWDAAQVEEKLAFEQQPDWPSAIAFGPDNKSVVVGRMDGSIAYYDTVKGATVKPAAPVLTSLRPLGIQRGMKVRLKVSGEHLNGLSGAKSSNTNLVVKLIPPMDGESQRWIEAEASTNLPRGSYQIALASPRGESGWQTIWVDNSPQVYMDDKDSIELSALPAACWGAISKPGAVRHIEFTAQAGETFVFDTDTKTVGSKARLNLTLDDLNGHFLAHAEGFSGTGEPLLSHKFTTSGKYRLTLQESSLQGSDDHYFRVSVGRIPCVTAFFPLGVMVGATSQVQLIGYNLPSNAVVSVHPTQAGEIALPLDPDLYHSRELPKLLVTHENEVTEMEPNDQIAQASTLKLPCVVNGRIWSPDSGNDVDLFKFSARKDQRIWIQTVTSERHSPLDTRIEVLDSQGRPVHRVLLQAVRDTHINFRGIDSNSGGARLDNYLEMELNQYLYIDGEVVRLFRAPQGPDSETTFYELNDRRRTYFDTSPTAHPLDTACFIVEPKPADAKPLPNGLPTFMLDYVNDDNDERRGDVDSKLMFVPPADGDYILRVSDARNAQGPEYAYRLTVREAAPDFEVTASGGTLVVPAGSGQSFSVRTRRIDGFDGEIKVELSGLPAGWMVSTPLEIQAGHTSANGTVYAPLNAPKLDLAHPIELKVKATAMIDGRSVSKPVNGFNGLKLGDKPKVQVALENVAASSDNGKMSSLASVEITIAPGETIPARLVIHRNGYDDLMTFSVQNLPHGIIVDNIGLNGVLIPKGQDEREIFLTAAKWVPETDRLCYAVENQVGSQTSPPVMLHVRRKGNPITAPPSTATAESTGR